MDHVTHARTTTHNLTNHKVGDAPSVRTYNFSPGVISVQVRGNGPKLGRISSAHITHDGAIELAHALLAMTGSKPEAAAPPAVDRLILTYVDREGVVTTRVVQPLGIKGTNMLAWDEAKAEFRTFKLTHILETISIGEPASYPPPPVPDHVFG